MYKVIDENNHEHFFDFISKINTVSDLKEHNEYIFVQEENCIVIWKVEELLNANESPFLLAIKDLCKYYREHHGRTFDLMQKKLVKL